MIGNTLRAIAISTMLTFGSAALAVPLTTEPNVLNLLTPCNTSQPLVGAGTGLNLTCWSGGPLGTAASFNVGTSGSTIGILNGVNTWSATQAFGAITASGINGNAWTAGSGTLTIGASKTATINNTLTLTGTDGSSIALGAGGTVLYSGGAGGTPSSIILTNGTGLPIAGISGLGTGVGTWLGTPSSANLAAALTDETGSGAAVFSTSPTLTTPVINGLSTGTGVATANTASTLVARDGSGNFSAGTITAALSGNATTATTAGTVTTNANLTGAVTSVGNATSLGSFSSVNLAGALTDETGSGSAVFGTSPILSTVDARGIWTTGTSWTLPAHTLGGTVSGGGNQINNVIIGTSTPLAGLFTTLSASTSLTSPVHIGGSAAGSTVELRTTSGTGSGDSAFVTGGTNGATRVATFLGSGLSGFGSAAGAAVPTNTVVEISSNATTVDANAGFATQLHLTGANSTSPTIVMDAFAGIPVMAFRRADGTAASKTALANTDTFMAFGGYGWNGSAYVQGAAINASASQAWTGSVNGAYLRFYTVATGATTSVENMRLWGSGGLSVGNGAIGTDPGTDGFQLNGQAFMPNMASDAATADSTVCTATTGGKLLKGSGTLGICLGTSSARYKQDIISMGAGLAEIVRLNPKNFFYKKAWGDGGKRLQYGFIAEDVVQVLPGVTAPDSAGKPNSVDMLAMVPVLVNAIKQLKSDNDNLRMDVLALQAKVGTGTRK